MEKKIVTMYFELEEEYERGGAYNKMMHTVWNRDVIGEETFWKISFLKQVSIYGEVIETTQDIIDLSVRLAKNNGIKVTVIDGDQHPDREFDLSAIRNRFKEDDIIFSWDNFTEEQFKAAIEKYQNVWSKGEVIGTVKQIENVSFEIVLRTCVTTIEMRLKIYADGEEMMNSHVETYNRGDKKAFDKYDEFKDKAEAMIIRAIK